MGLALRAATAAGSLTEAQGGRRRGAVQGQAAAMWEPLERSREAIPERSGRQKVLQAWAEPEAVLERSRTWISGMKQEREQSARTDGVRAVSCTGP